MTRINPLARRQGETIALASHQQVTPIELCYDYSQVAEADRKTVMGAAVEIKAHEKRATESMIRIGQKLLQVKALLPHGQFGEWIGTEFGLSQKTAERMMSVAENFGGKIDTVSILSSSALYLLSGPSVPEAARDEVVARAQETGKSPTKVQVQGIIGKHQPKGLVLQVLPSDLAARVVHKAQHGPDKQAQPETQQGGPAVQRNRLIKQALDDCRLFALRLDEIAQLSGQFEECERVRREVYALADGLRRNLT